MILPYVLAFYLRGEAEGSPIVDMFFTMAQAAGIASHYSDGTGKAVAAAALVEGVRSMLTAMKVRSRGGRATDAPPLPGPHTSCRAPRPTDGTHPFWL